MLKNMIEKYSEVKARREDGEGGFTLIELLVVVVIIGILVAIAIPLYLNYTQGAKANSLESDVRNAVTTVQQCYSDNDQTLPANQVITTSGTALVGSGTTNPCAADTVVLSSGTSEIDFAAATGGGYTVVGKDKNDTNEYTYTSASGTTTKTKG